MENLNQKAEITVTLDFEPRNFQIPVLNALHSGKRNVFIVWPRRSGKDLTLWNYCIRKCLESTIQIYYCLPTFSQGRKVIFDGMDFTGKRFIDYIPSPAIAAINQQEMKVRFINGSLLQVIGSDSYDRSLVGTNPSIIVFSEYATTDNNKAYQFAQPILSANGGTVIFASTPRGHNHFWEIYEIARNSPDWFCERLTLDETEHIPLWEIEKIRASGTMSDDLIRQEFYCDFEQGVEGSIYGRYIDRAIFNNQISVIPWESSFPTHTAWDFGIKDPSCVIWWQSIGQTIRIIDYHEEPDRGFADFLKILPEKPYTYGTHLVPHDAARRDDNFLQTRIDIAYQMGIPLTLVQRHLLADGIESVKANFNKIYIDEHKCKKLLDALRNYRRTWDADKKMYSTKPVHDWASHGADALRTLCTGIKLVGTSLTTEDIDEMYYRARNKQYNMPKELRRPY